MKTLSTDKMLATYLLVQLHDDFKDAKPGHSVAYRCRDSDFREMLEHWLRCSFKNGTLKITKRDEFDHRGVEFFLEVVDDQCPTRFALRLLNGMEFLVTLQESN